MLVLIALLVVQATIPNRIPRPVPTGSTAMSAELRPDAMRRVPNGYHCNYSAITRPVSGVIEATRQGEFTVSGTSDGGFTTDFIANFGTSKFIENGPWLEMNTDYAIQASFSPSNPWSSTWTGRPRINRTTKAFQAANTVTDNSGKKTTSYSGTCTGAF